MGSSGCLSHKEGWNILLLYRLRQAEPGHIEVQLSLPNVQDCLDSLDEAKVLSSMDLCSGYWKVKRKPGTRLHFMEQEEAFEDYRSCILDCAIPMQHLGD